MNDTFWEEVSYKESSSKFGAVSGQENQEGTNHCTFVGVLRSTTQNCKLGDYTEKELSLGIFFSALFRSLTRLYLTLLLIGCGTSKICSFCQVVESCNCYVRKIGR